jgi:putative SOS response-associated peptidase YedK
MHIQLKGGHVFAFAGLWLPGKRDGGVPSAAIVTTAPNELMATIHTRMPAILRPEDEAAWLDPQLADAQQVMALVRPYPTECMQAYPVASLVNSWENEGPELIAEVTPDVQLSF